MKRTSANDSHKLSQVTGNRDAIFIQKARERINDTMVQGDTGIHSYADLHSNGDSDIHGSSGSDKDSIIATLRSQVDSLNRQLDLFQRTNRIAQVGGWEIDLPTMTRSWSRDSFHLLGYAEGQPRECTHDALSFYAPSSRPIVQQAIERSIRNHESFDIEVEMQTANGGTIWVRDRGFVECSNDQPVRIIGAIHDITDVKRVQEHSLERTAFFEALVDSSIDGILVVDANKQKILMNRQLHRVWNIPREVAGDSDDIRQIAAVANQTVDPEDFVNRINYLYEHPNVVSRDTVELVNGTVLDRFSSPVRDKNGKYYGRIWAFRDITEQESIKQALRESEDRWKFAIEGSGDGIWDWDLETDKVFVSQRWKELFGMNTTDESHVLAEWRSRTHPDNQAELLNRLREHFDGDTEVYQYEYRVLCRDNEWKWVLGRGVVVSRDENGKPLRMIGTHTDITRRREAELNLQVTNEMLEEARNQAVAASRAKSEFLANMSHEIRTPLTSILGFAEILSEEENHQEPNVKRLHSINTIRSAGMHLLTVINDILDLSKIEAHKTTVESVETPLVDILSEIENLFGPRAAAKGITLAMHAATQVPQRFLSDPTRFRQILMNLVGNSIKFTEAGQVEIVVSVSATNAKITSLHVDIKDTGIGMSPEHCSQLFQAFEQADGKVTRRYGGTGLGLAISRRLAELMGGQVRLVSSSLGAGSHFQFTLPLSTTASTVWTDRIEPTVAPVSTSNESSRPSLSGRILLVEDGVDNQRLISFHLTRAGADVDIAENGRVALQKLEAMRIAGTIPNLMLTDMQMPEMDGFALSRTLRETGVSIPIIAITANALSEDRQRCLDAGCNDYIAKPITRSDLLRICSKWIGSERVS